ncbi:E3 ubiquitin-protein ligase RNFT1 isoform X2 [Neophocaena asiaeorientalis asiaeorientalis]|uniref:E3 ubiquitin-protein ligase RNFT1 n=1 Tax=Neophocaena asiaeorientalis asiaeorientalis TaxID=1706337 RepID=A0A341CFC0_NEOAA|nr:E3 ubiquitin-protein ligase RNFT1 isoform X2 [Neophocaena asiaeorientalis asiaeorientalis]XP_032471130.1 E3 ubiquitin-protein ligase RNFT1 isoform X2 [Phocoena sinus]
MQANCSQLHSPSGAAGSEDASASQCVQTRLTGEASCLYSGDVHIQINSMPKECAENPSSRNVRSGVHGCTHGCVHSRLRSHSHNEARQPDDTEMESGDHGISLGVGLLTTFIYANKSIVNQVFLRERCSKIQCAWLLVFLAGSSVLLYYTFHSQSLYYSLIFFNPTLDYSSFWDVLWIVGITDFILKFLFMGLKCLILLVPSFIMPFKSKGYWYMVLEELCQYYRTFVPVPVWFRYLISYGEFGNVTGWSLGILLALLYLILKLLDFFGHLRTFRQVLRIFFTRPSHGVAASKRQCSDVDDICSICQAEFQKPILLTCQHIFCEECITLWFNREKTCPLCRIVISDHINKWQDGATSSHLQIY